METDSWLAEEMLAWRDAWEGTEPAAWIVGGCLPGMYCSVGCAWHRCLLQWLRLLHLRDCCCCIRDASHHACCVLDATVLLGRGQHSILIGSHVVTSAACL